MHEASNCFLKMKFQLFYKRNTSKKNRWQYYFTNLNTKDNQDNFFFVSYVFILSSNNKQLETTSIICFTGKCTKNKTVETPGFYIKYTFLLSILNTFTSTKEILYDTQNLSMFHQIIIYELHRKTILNLLQ